MRFAAISFGRVYMSNPDLVDQLIDARIQTAVAGFELQTELLLAEDSAQPVAIRHQEERNTGTDQRQHRFLHAR